MKNFEIKITKTKKILEVDNCYAHNYYWLYYIRIYNEDHTKYRKAHFIVWFDIFDVQEWYEDTKEFYTDKDIKDYADELASCQFIDYIKSFEDVQEFFELCNQSILDYNKIRSV